jgi:hypothetical protein
MSDELTYPIGLFAPGSYMCRCATCEQSFTRDKRAIQCETCALRDAAFALQARIAALEEALKPFAARVYNDNGELTVTDEWRCTVEDFTRAYFVHRASLAQGDK